MADAKRPRPRQALPPVHAHAAAIDIGATIHVAAVGPDHDPEPVRTFGTFTDEIRRMADWLPPRGIETIVMESTGIYWADSSGRRNASTKEVAVNARGRCPDRSGRGALRSPGRPSVARREDRRRFWAAFAAGRSSEDAAVDAGVSPVVGVRWFREAGGMPPSHLSRSSRPQSGRHLSFAEREEIAIRHAQGHGVREIARRLARAPSTLLPA